MKLASQKATQKVRGLICRARKSRTFGEVAKKAQVSERALRNWLNGDSRARAEHVERATKNLSQIV